MNKSKLAKLYTKYNLSVAEKDVFTHKHYVIITRQGIDKIQAIEKINITYEVIKCEKDFAVVKAIAAVGEYKIQTFGSALFGGKENVNGKWKETGTTNSLYIMEIAEKRAMSRAVLKLTGFYQLGVFGEDESEDFKEGDSTPKTTTPQELKPYPPESYEKGAIGIHGGKCTIEDIAKKFKISSAAKQIIEGIVTRLAHEDILAGTNEYEHSNN